MSRNRRIGRVLIYALLCATAASAVRFFKHFPAVTRLTQPWPPINQHATISPQLWTMRRDMCFQVVASTWPRRDGRDSLNTIFRGVKCEAGRLPAIVSVYSVSLWCACFALCARGSDPRAPGAGQSQWESYASRGELVPVDSRLQISTDVWTVRPDTLHLRFRTPESGESSVVTIFLRLALRIPTR